jgi:protein O-GlcNAc transferase
MEYRIPCSTRAPTIEYRIPYTSCPLCSGEFSKLGTYKVIDSKHSYLPNEMKEMQWLSCNVCGHIFTDGYFNQEGIDLLFSNKDLPNKNDNIAAVEHKRHFFAGTLNRVTNYKNEGKWLDVGFGDGALLVVAEEYGFDVVGIDLDPERSEFLNSIVKIEAHCCDIENFDQKDFDVISFMDIIEHTPFPVKALEAANSKLKSGGIILISTPNSGSILWDLFTDSKINPYWYEPNHYHNFSRKNLYSLLKKIGFEPKKYAVGDRYKLSMEVMAVKGG